jgi:hypothetical protein
MQRIHHRHGISIRHHFELTDWLHTISEQLSKAGVQLTGIRQRHRDDKNQHQQRHYSQH